MIIRLVSLLIVTSCLVIGLPTPSFAQFGARDSSQLVPVAMALRGIGRIEFDAITAGGRSYVPMNTLFKFLRLNIEYVRGSNLVEGFYIKPDTRYRIDGAALTATAGSKSVALSSTDFVTRAEDFYLRSELYDSLFGLNVKYNPRRLEVTLETKVQLPVFVERAREAARRRKLAFGEIPHPDYLMSRRFVPFGFGRLDYNFISQISQHGTPRRSYDVHTGSQLLGGDFDARLNGTFSEPLTFDDVLLRLRYAFLNTSSVRQLILGDVLALGLQPTNVLGVEITNRPAPRRYFFATEDITSSVPPGSISDLYLGGALVDYQKIDVTGEYSFSSILTYGVSQFDVRSYDSLGVERENQYHIIVPPTMLPPNEVQYDVIGGRIHPLRDEAYYGNGIIQWGVNSRLTIGGGVDYYYSKALSLTRKFHPMLTGTARLTQLLVGDFVYAPTAYSRNQLSITFPSSAGIALAYTKYQHNNPYYNPRDIDEDASLAFSLPYYREGFRLALDMLVRQTTFTTRRERVFQPTLSGQFSIFSPRITHRRVYDWYSLPNDPAIDAVTIFTMGIRAPAGFLFRGTTQYFHYDHGFRNLRLELSKRFTREIWLQVFYDRSVITQSTIAGIQFIYYFPFTLLRGLIGTGGESGFRSSQSLSGSIGYSGETGDFYLDYLSNRVGFGGLVLQPFVDANGNGIQDPGEESITKATIQTRSVSGRQYLHYSPSVGFTLPHTLPYEEYFLTIDPQSLDNPLWIPRYNNFAVISEPNQFRQVQLPVIVGGVIRGKVEGQSGGKTSPLEGISVTVQSADSTTGQKVFQVSGVTYSTGEFEFIGVPPGRYVVALNEKFITDLGYRTTQSSRIIEVQAKPEGDEVNDVNFILVK